ncbi:type II toxin-antitoxin system VapB family antitoxin [uncultured Enterovirga sp.]|uniref:type II toxin-antitoxin system VapB family antitoxin n=1 Tax=uncultured Enterovirga sp. TaxID=2026352 RepID=UPI0035CC9DCA
MSINIKNREAEALVTELKRRTGKGTTDLLLDLLRREKDRLERDIEAEVESALAFNRAFRERWNALPIVDPRPIEEILAYDENGLPV